MVKLHQQATTKPESSYNTFPCLSIVPMKSSVSAVFAKLLVPTLHNIMLKVK